MGVEKETESLPPVVPSANTTPRVDVAARHPRRGRVCREERREEEYKRIRGSHSDVASKGGGERTPRGSETFVNRRRDATQRSATQRSATQRNATQTHRNDGVATRHGVAASAQAPSPSLAVRDKCPTVPLAKFLAARRGAHQASAVPRECTRGISKRRLCEAPRWVFNLVTSRQ